MSVESSPHRRLSTVQSLLSEVGQARASGVLEVVHPDGSSSHVWVREGRIYALQVPGYRPALGIRLLSGGQVSPEQLSAAALEQRERRPGQLIGEVLVGMGLVSADVIEAFVREQVLDQAADLLDLEVSSAEFHEGRHIRQGLAEPVDPETLLVAASECRDRRGQALARIGGPGVVPCLGPPPSAPTRAPLGPNDWALLCRVDGTRDLAELARVCGFTVVEAARIVDNLSVAGLLALPDPTVDPDPALAPVVALPGQAEAAAPEWSFEGTDAGEPDPAPLGTTPEQTELLSEFGALLHDETPPSQEEPASRGEEALPAAPRTPTGPEHDDEMVEEPTRAPAPQSLPPDHEPLLTLVAAGPALDEASTAQSTTPMPTPAAAPDVQRGEESPPGDPDADTTAFMRELSSLSDDPAEEEPVVTRLVVPLTEPRRRRRLWHR